MFALRADSAKRFNSTNSTVVAPRDRDSSPRAPDPANKSRTRAPRMGRCRMLNHASRTRSAGGRPESPARGFGRRAFKSPAERRVGQESQRLESNHSQNPHAHFSVQKKKADRKRT